MGRKKGAAVLSLALCMGIGIAMSACTKTSDNSETTSEKMGKETVSTPAVEPVVSQNFDIESLPINQVSLGEFPYIGLAQGYTYKGIEQPILERVPYWTGQNVQWVEGRLFSAGIVSAHTDPSQKDDASFLEIQKNMQAVMQQLGAVEITYSSLPKEMFDRYFKDFSVPYYDGAAGIYGAPQKIQTFVIHQANKDIWIHFAQASDQSAGVMVTETTSIPISAQQTEKFPYLGLPKGYMTQGDIHANAERYPFWDGQQWQWVEGKLYSAGIRPQNDNKTASYLEIKHNLAALVKQMGGKELTHSAIPQAMFEHIPQDMMVKFNDSLGAARSKPVTTYIIDKADKKIWVQLSQSVYAHVGLTIVETQPVEITAQALSANALKAELEKSQKVNIQVNFASNKADILPESQAQIQQVINLLKENPDLKLSVNGHTDHVGQAAHNLRLSKARADSVKQALVKAGIADHRLKAQGFGDTQPITDNQTTEAQAQNRRVELVKQSS